MDHFTGHDHGHDHAHGHGHDHDHHHGDSLNNYYIEQLITVFMCGAFGVVGILMYRFGKLDLILSEDFRFPVFLGGIGLLGLTLLRGVALWREAGRRQAHAHAGHEHHHHAPGEACDHNHAPGEKCDHDHGHNHHHHHHGHDHGDHDASDHEHGGGIWRLIILLIPVTFFVMGLPNRGFSKRWISDRLGQAAELGKIEEVAAKEGGEAVYDFNSLTMAANYPERRAALEGTTAIIKGQFRPLPYAETDFELYFLKMTCCLTDLVPLQARIVVTRPSVMDGVRKLGIKEQDWVQVRGTIQFQYIEQKKKWITVITVRDVGGVSKTAPQNSA